MGQSLTETSSPLMVRCEIKYPNYMKTTNFQIKMSILDPLNSETPLFAADSKDEDSILNKTGFHNIQIDPRTLHRETTHLVLKVVQQGNLYEGVNINLGNQTLVKKIRISDLDGHQTEDCVNNSAFKVLMKPDIDLPTVFAKIEVKV